MTKSVLIFIVAYNHEKTIQEVLGRIPDDLDRYDTEVLIIDDASGDNTFRQSAAVAETDQFPFRLTVLKNPTNQGYGGNQKIGFFYAMENNFDVVALVHGDGQYAPEILPNLLKPAIEEKADAVFGSRMMESGAALKGGMPLYKFVGNKILTFFQNAILKANLTEFHSGYRIYRVNSLRQIPFHLNTNDFHFDTEIIIQLILAGKSIKELPIPTYYGDEICNVDGLKYAKDVLRVTSLVPFQKLGVFYQRKYDLRPENQEGSLYQAKLDFDSSHTRALDLVSQNSKVLDVGCGPTVVTKALKAKGCTITGIDAAPPPYKDDLDSFIQADLDADKLPEDIGKYDHILLLDVIEHLKRPEDFVEQLHAKMQSGRDTELIVSTGNVAFFLVRMMLTLGSFNYGKRGILDLDHKRLFTFSTFRKLFENRGFEIMDVQGIPAPYALAIGNNWLEKLLSGLNRILIQLSKDLFSYQILFRLKTRPSLAWLLAQAEKKAQEESRLDV